jgi:hypothetical protein
MDGRAFGVYWDFVERQRKRVVELEADAGELDRRYSEAWFQTMAMGQDGATPADKQEASDNLERAAEDLEAAKLALETARRRLALYEQTLDQYTPT